jgi:hypothetical protein
MRPYHRSGPTCGSSHGAGPNGTKEVKSMKKYSKPQAKQVSFGVVLNIRA